MPLTAPRLLAPPLQFDEVALFLDLDGTLAPIASTPDEVGPDPRRTESLRALVRKMGGRVAVLTGRRLDEADRILGGAVAAVGALHGLERRTSDGRVLGWKPSDGLPQVRVELAALAGTREGLLMEDKGASVALHYRNAPEAEIEVRRTTGRLARAFGLVQQNGSMVSELRTPGPNKGDALRAFMAEPPFVGRLPLVVGDDLTDEDAFAVADEMGGYGVLVGLPRASRARYGLGSVAEVLAWIAGEGRS
jgi:trehalose 6-phosphate phosphatase